MDMLIEFINMAFWVISIFILITFVPLCFLRFDYEWLYGLYQTLFAVIFSRRPKIFKYLVEEEITASDGEKYMVWWSSKETQTFIKNNETGENEINVLNAPRIWIIVPGGMTSADSFYIWDTIESGLFHEEHWCIFHNPGIVNKCIKRSPAALTETKYLEQFILKLKHDKWKISIIGFSAGSMLTISMAKRGDQIDIADSLNKESPTLECCVAIHGPDRIRDVFESFRDSYSRLDILFSLSLYNTMCNSGCTKFLPPNAGGGLHENRFAWTGGWNWMKSYTESVFQSPWDEMEASLWSCETALASPLKTPVMRVLSLNDPLINFSHCCNSRYFLNIDKLYLQPKAGHCCAFRYDKKLASYIRSWRTNVIQRTTRE